MFLAAGMGGGAAALTVPPAWVPNPAPPAQTAKLIFIHHSTGENWLRDDYGDLGKTLNANNYFVSDTNYGWGPNGIGDRTDIPNWREWFRSAQTPTYMKALYSEDGQHSSYTRTRANPGGENRIVMFKSCFPNSNLTGNPTDPANSSDPEYSVGHSKYVYNELLKYFRTRPDKLFIVITAPPLIHIDQPENPRAFNNWLVNDWLSVNHYPFSNVAVFDFYNVLTAVNAHHRYNAGTGTIEHIVVAGKNELAYPSGGDDHPNEAGSQKATDEFVPLLNIFYNFWKAEDTPHYVRFYSEAARDGWILESSETSGAGGTLDAGSTTLRLGDDASKKQYRGILSFNTSSLPDTAVVAQARLELTRNSIVGSGNPFNIFQGMFVDMRKGYYSSAAALQTGDFNATAHKPALGPFKPTPSGALYTIYLPPTASPYVNKLSTNGGLTQVRLRFKLDDDNNTAANFISFYSGESASYRPSLFITYYMP
jgi:hypothetical protein